MGRPRIIKPSFFKDDVLAELPPLTRLFYIGLWTMADREGRMEDRPKRIKAEILPYDDCDIDTLLDELASLRLIDRYEIKRDEDNVGGDYIQVIGFVRQQKRPPFQHEPPSDFPEPEWYNNPDYPDEEGAK